MKVRTKNTTTLEQFLSEIQAIPGVNTTATSIVLSTFMEGRPLPVEPMELNDYETESVSSPSAA